MSTYEPGALWVNDSRNSTEDSLDTFLIFSICKFGEPVLGTTKCAHLDLATYPTFLWPLKGEILSTEVI